MDHTKEKTNYALLIALCVSIFSYCFLSQYIFPSGDDFTYALKGSTTTNFLQSLHAEWLHWNGRYISNVLVLINPIRPNDFFLYRLTPPLLLVGFIFTHWISIKILFSTSRIQAFFCATGLLALYLNVIPEIGEGIYWYTSAVTYFLTLLIFPLYLLSLHKREGSKSKNIWILILIVTQFLMTGLNEIVLIFLILIHSFYYFNNKSTVRLALLASQLVFASVVIFAPGNAVRSSYFSNNHDVLYTLFMGGGQCLRFTLMILINPITWVFVFLVLQSEKTVDKIRGVINFKFPLWKWIALFLLPQFIACTAPIWTTGILGQHRTPNLAIYCQMLILILYLVNNSQSLLAAKVASVCSEIGRNKLTIIAIVFLFFWSNGLTVTTDLLSGKAKDFKTENENREAALQSFTKLKDCIINIPQLKNRAESIFIYDITENPKHWKNEGYSMFYGLKNKNIQIKGIK